MNDISGSGPGDGRKIRSVLAPESMKIAHGGLVLVLTAFVIVGILDNPMTAAVFVALPFLAIYLLCFLWQLTRKRTPRVAVSRAYLYAFGWLQWFSF